MSHKIELTQFSYLSIALFRVFLRPQCAVRMMGILAAQEGFTVMTGVVVLYVIKKNNFDIHFWVMISKVVDNHVYVVVMVLWPSRNCQPKYIFLLVASRLRRLYILLSSSFYYYLKNLCYSSVRRFLLIFLGIISVCLHFLLLSIISKCYVE